MIYTKKSESLYSPLQSTTEQNLNMMNGDVHVI